jgi:hypothetical protein
VQLAGAVAAWIGLSLAASVATMIIGSEVAPRLAANTLAVIILVGYAVVGAWAPLVEELVWVGRDGGRLGSLAPVTTAVTLLRGDAAGGAG